MKQFRTFTLLFSALLVLGVACSDSSSNSEPQITQATLTDIPADTAGTGSFTLLNLTTGEIVTDSATTTWDIGFQSTTIIINGGTSGPGEGGAYIIENISFDDVTEVPTNIEFAVDNGAELAIPVGSGNGWYNYNPQLFAIFPKENAVILVRTATGNYAKLEILSYYQGNPDVSSPEFQNPGTRTESRFYTLNVTVNEDGDTIFE